MPPPAATLPVARRTLRFETIDEALADADRLAGSERAGALRASGAWTLGQALNHLATWAGYAYTGTPLKVPAVVRWIIRLRKRKFLYAPMRAGARIPKVKGGTLATEVVPLDEGLSNFRAAFVRLNGEPPTRPHVLFGRLTHEEWIALHLRHAELHLSFFTA